MLFYRCKCGKSRAFGSMPPNRCDSCSSCGSDLALGPDRHRDPESHDFTLVQEVDTDQGVATITYCRWCHLTRAEIERRKST